MTTQTKQAVPAGTYKADPVHSSVGFAVTHNGVLPFRSTFDSYDATLTGGEQPRLEGTVEVSSIAISEEMLKGHVLSPDFFDAEKHPRLRFSTTEFDVSDDGSVRLRGKLEIRGAEHEVEATGKFAQLGEDLGGSARVGVSLAASIDRREFGLDWQAELPSGGEVLANTVDIAVELELVAEAE
jgi:polyisoprenoid-binding protein YceI